MVVYFSLRPLREMNILTAGILFGALHAAVQGKVVQAEFSNWDWFDWAKRPSLFAGWGALCSIQFFRDATWPSVFTQWVLAANVLEAGLRGIQDKDYVSGILCILLSPFSPFIFVSGDGYVKFKQDCKILGLPLWNPLPCRWYCRMHCVTLGAFYAFGKSFKTASLFFTLTCTIPLMWMECVDQEMSNTAQIFMIRPCSLIWAAIVDSFAFTQYTNFPTIGDAADWLLDHVIARNVLQAIVTFVLLSACLMRDKVFPLGSGPVSGHDSEVARLSARMACTADEATADYGGIGNAEKSGVSLCHCQ